jgi:hypothetical protein
MISEPASRMMQEFTNNMCVVVSLLTFGKVAEMWATYMLNKERRR